MTYTIADLEQLSGVSAHNIRIWERRYNALDPMRTSGNTRFYGDDQLRRLLNIISLNQAGIKISNACSLNEIEMYDLLQKEIDKTISADKQFEYYISQIISNGFIYNEEKVDQLITQCLNTHGVLETYKNVIYSLLVRLGLMWRKDSICPSQEHFLSSLIRQKLFSSINDLPPVVEPQSVWLLFLPENEDHDIGLLLANYLLRAAGHRVIYLGAKVPINAANNACEACKPNNVLLFMTRSHPIKDAESYLNQLSSALGKVPIYLSGNRRLIGSLTLGNNITWLQNILEFEKVIKTATDA